MDIPNSTTTKRCTKCDKVYPATAEYFSYSRGKLRSDCKGCRNQYNKRYYIEHAAEMNERARQYRIDNPDVITRINREYYQSNAETLRKYAREYREQHPEVISEYRARCSEHIKRIKKAWRKSNADSIREYGYHYRVENQDWFKRYRRSERGRVSGRKDAHNRRARKLSAGGSFTAADIEAIRTAQGNRCYLCGDRLKKFHIDHFIPLALGGTNEPGNLRLACPKCNLSKGAKHPHDMGRLI